MDDSLASNISDLPDVSFQSCISTSTPNKSQRKRPAPRTAGTFKVPAAKKARKGPICGVCDICGKDYVRKKSYLDHMRMHVLTDVNSHYPNQEKIMNEIPAISRATLLSMNEVKSVGVWGGQFNAFVQEMLTLPDNSMWLSYTKDVANRIIPALVTGKFMLPATLLPTVIKCCESYLSSLSERKINLDFLQKINVVYSQDMLETFHCDYVHIFGEEVIRFICKSVIGEKPRKEVTIPIVFDIEDRQVIFYVAGATMRGFLRSGKRYSKNAEWCAIVNCIESRIREGNGVPLCCQADRAWTDELNRKSLFFIGAPGMEFFVALTAVLYNIESDESGKFKDDVVLKDVFADSVCILLWDELIGNSLTEVVALRFLKGVVKSYTDTYGRGVAYKKLNTHLKKSFAAISLRHGLAPRGGQ
ncbi:Transcriptional regulator CRZ1 [Frankliniella fusca]|uniref:Transcriptional regulator CRZ1 n=1 Tax=Frankliniella fusca TaxID=407009 RepID=A0AAE1HXD9_9NEOP|nr:Transcriptional regulator CRZ1 [Frankliniella fusca]